MSPEILIVSAIEARAAVHVCSEDDPIPGRANPGRPLWAADLSRSKAPPSADPGSSGALGNATNGVRALHRAPGRALGHPVCRPSARIPLGGPTPAAGPACLGRPQRRISTHRGRRFSLIVDVVSAGSWTMGWRASDLLTRPQAHRIGGPSRCQPTESRCADGREEPTENGP